MFGPLKKMNSIIKITIVVICLSQIAHSKEAQQAGLDSLQLTAGDEAQNEIKAAKAELLVRKTEDMALKQIQELLRKHKNTPMEVELNFRLGELYMRRAKTERFFEVHKESETIARLLPKKVKNASQKGEINKAIATYEGIRKKFPHYEKIDLVLFNCAFARQLTNDDNGAEKLYWEIVSQHGQSSLVPDAHLAIGEINYEKRNFKLALDHFLVISKYANSRAFSYGMYKAAWAYYNLQQAPMAMSKLEEVVKHGQYVTDNGLDARLDLRKEALKDMALFYGDVYSPEKAISYFLKQARDLDGAPYILTLVGMYKRHGKLKDVEFLLHDFIKELPKSEKIPEAYDELVWNYEKMLDREKAVTQLSSFSSYCKGLSKKDDSSRSQICVEKIAETSQRLSAKWHNLWTKNNKLPLFSKAAAVAYEVYLSFAPAQTEEMAQTRFNYGEMLFNNGDYRKAVEQYAFVRLAKANAQLLHDGDYAAIVSLERSVSDTWNDKDEKQFQSLATFYIADNPKGKYVLDLKFKKAVIAYQKNRYDEAMPQFKDIGWNFPKTEQGLKSQDLYLDILNLKKDFSGLRASAKSLLSLNPQGARLIEIKKIYQQAYFAEIQTNEDRKSVPNLEVAQSYISFARENKESDLASQAWWNATQIYTNEGKLMEAADACAEMPVLFPKFSKNKECLIMAAKNYEELAQLEKSIGILFQLAEINKEKQVQWKELAADFLNISGQHLKSISTYDSLLPLLEKESLGRVLWKQVEIAKSEGMPQVLSRAFDRILKSDLEPYSSKVQAQQAEQLFNTNKFPEAFKRSLSVVGSKSALAEDKAKARYVQAMILKKEFEDQSVKSRADRLATVLAIKTEKLEKAQRAFQSTILFKNPEYSLRSLKQLSFCYLSYAKALKTLPAPEGMGTADAEMLKQEIEKLILPMEEKGIETLAQAVKLAKDMHYHDGLLVELQHELDIMNMKKTSLPQLKLTNPSIFVPEARSSLGVL